MKLKLDLTKIKFIGAATHGGRGVNIAMLVDGKFIADGSKHPLDLYPAPLGITPEEFADLGLGSKGQEFAWRRRAGLELGEELPKRVAAKLAKGTW